MQQYRLFKPAIIFPFIKLKIINSVCFPFTKKTVTEVMITLTCINCSLFVDIDECTRGTHNCHSSLASCTNTVGSFSCSCSNPYIGDGKTCINIPHGNYYHQELGCLFSLDPYLHSLEACYFNLDCLKRVSVKCKCYPDLLSTNPKARSGQLIKFNSPLY